MNISIMDLAWSLSNDKSISRKVYIHLLATASTSILMWAYAFCAAITISSPIPAVVGITCSVIHLLSPLLFLKTNNLLLVTLGMLLPGVIHQSTFAYFTGGFNSHILIWFGIIPLLAGVIEGKKSTIATTCIVFFIATTYLGLELLGFNFPNEISQNGRMFAQSLLVFGYIGIASIVVFHYVGVTERHSLSLEEQKDKNYKLLQILLHDMSNNIQKISLNNSALSRKNTCNSSGKNILDISNAVDGLGNIIGSVRAMHLFDIQKKSLRLGRHLLRDIIEGSIKDFSHILDKNKQEIVVADIKSHVLCDPSLLQNQVLANILSNAIKFSPTNSQIHINEIVNENEVVLTVKDNGVGMPEEILSNLFNSGFDTTRLGFRNEKGSGLGMIIAKSMLEKMDGSLEVESATEGDNKGTRFSIRLSKAT
ncbi:MAG: hypothetical protein CME64_13870 [Halobacteriovoraceae bacterium]|nr:hypothetical protein [Halobacteriovoraceae bacterium]|tara:strand:+ start:18154 stop:19422 length:1269 start_codon:yes stop_codon:yes gene_type:complete